MSIFVKRLASLLHINYCAPAGHGQPKQLLESRHVGQYKNVNRYDY